MYSNNDSLVALSDNNYDIDLVASSDSDIDSSDREYDPDDEILVGEIPPFSYDVDRVLTDVKQCKEVVIQHAMLNDHAIKSIKTNKGRFRTVCLRADKGCLWMVFASTNKKKYSGAR
jgi:hypothetical protein